MAKGIVGRKDFELAREEWLEHISDVLNSEFDDIAGFKAGEIVDIDIEENKATGVAGIRMDNNFGVVGGEDAILFAEALELSARIANDFKYLGMAVSDDKSNAVDLCDYVCGWVHDNRGKSPKSVCDEYPEMMRKVLESFSMGGETADEFVKCACAGNWERMHLTSLETCINAGMLANVLLDEVWYCSDRWSWDRVIRVQWLYRRLVDRCTHAEIA